MSNDRLLSRPKVLAVATTVVVCLACHRPTATTSDTLDAAGDAVSSAMPSAPAAASSNPCDVFGACGMGSIGTGPAEGLDAGIGLGYVDAARSAQPSARLARVTELEERFSGPGKLPSEVIRRIVRQQFPWFRQCYEAGLAHNADLQGSLSIKFVIGVDGAVETAFRDAGSLASESVIACVVSRIRIMSLPPPEGGKMTVVFVSEFEKD